MYGERAEAQGMKNLCIGMGERVCAAGKRGPGREQLLPGIVGLDPTELPHEYRAARALLRVRVCLCPVACWPSLTCGLVR